MQRELKFAQEAAENAGNKIMTFYQNDYEIQQKGYHNPVTEADYAANTAIISILSKEFPDDGILSEETIDSNERLHKSRVWIIDPLDGTKEFIEGIPNFVVSIALTVNKLPVLGVLYNPVTHEMFAGVKGQGATLNGNPIRCSNEDDLNNAKIVVSRSEQQRGLWNGMGDWFGEKSHVGSVAYKLGLTAVGKYDCFVTLRPKNEWDVCAGDIILRESGGQLVNLDDCTFREYNLKKTLITPGLIGGNNIMVQKFHEKWLNQIKGMVS